MSLQYWTILVTVVLSLSGLILITRPFGRGSRYVVLILVAYTVLWVGLGHAWGYGNGWAIGLPLVAAVADLAALPWWLKHVDRETEESKSPDDE